MNKETKSQIIELRNSLADVPHSISLKSAKRGGADLRAALDFYLKAPEIIDVLLTHIDILEAQMDDIRDTRTVDRNGRKVQIGDWIFFADRREWGGELPMPVRVELRGGQLDHSGGTWSEVPSYHEAYATEAEAVAHRAALEGADQ